MEEGPDLFARLDTTGPDAAELLRADVATSGPDVGGCPGSRDLDGGPRGAELDGAAQGKIQHLEIALAHRTVIGQATGMVMERFELCSDAAFEVLRRLSSEQNRKLYEIAQQLIATGQTEGL